MSKELPYVLDEATKRDIPIFVSSNGIMINEERAKLLCNSSLRDIQISIDSPEKETLEFIRRGADFDKLIKGIKTLVRVRNEMGKEYPKIDLHAALLAQGIDQFPDLIRLAAELGVDSVSCAYGWTHKIMEPEWSIFWDRDNANRRVEEARLVAKDLGIGFNSPMPFATDTLILEPPSRYCEYLYNWTYIQPSGNVSPCCIGSYSSGNLKAESFNDIWNGEKYNELRATYNTDKPVYDKCAGCYITSKWNPDDYKAHFAPEHWEYCENRLKDEPPKVWDYCRYGDYIFDGSLIDTITAIFDYRTDGNNEAALQLMEQSMDSDANSLQMYLLLVDVLKDVGDLDRANHVLSQLMNQCADNPTVSNKMTEVYILQKNYGPALKLIEKALQDNPHDYRAHQNISVIKDAISRAKGRNAGRSSSLQILQ